MKLTEHQRLLLPYDPPLPATVGGTLPSIPQFWERTKLFFARVIDHIGSTANFSKRWRLTRAEKTTLLGWLEPVEKLARSCLLVRALNFLMMTPQGLKLLRETPKMAMPSPPKPPGQASTIRSTKIPLGGWHTHAPYARYLAERRRIEEQKAAERAARDRHDPATWGGGFRVVGWTFPEDESRTPQKKLPQWAMLLRLSLDDTPITPAIARPLPKEEKDRPALILARRVEALARVIEKPEPAIHRLARFIAKLPKEALEALTTQYTFTRPHWLQGRDLDILHGAAHARRAASVCYALDSS